jgi:phage shock protein A
LALPQNRALARTLAEKDTELAEKLAEKDTELAEKLAEKDTEIQELRTQLAAFEGVPPRLCHLRQ